MKIELCCVLLVLSSQVSLLAESSPFCYNYTANQSVHKIDLCLTAGRSNSSQLKASGIPDRSIDDGSSSPYFFCSPNSAVNKYFSLVNLRIPSDDGRIAVEDIERSCDVVISAGDNSVSFYNAFHKDESSPFVLAYPLINRNIFLDWSDLVAWRHWMTKKGFGKYITKQVDLQNPTYPLVLREALSESGRGAHVINTPEELRQKVRLLRERGIAFLAEELLGDSSMGRTQHGAFYVTAYEGRVLNLQGYVLAEESNSSTSAPEGISTAHRIKFDLEVANLVSRITKRARYTGVYCAYYKLNDQHQIVFVQFSALMCPLLRRRDDCFLEAYLPLTFAIHKHLRIAQEKSPSPRLSAIIARTDAWFLNRTLSDLSHGFQMHSKASLDMHAPLPTLSDLVLKAVGFAEVR